MSVISENIHNIASEYIKRTAKECYKIVKIKDETPFLMENKMGGMPYIPQGKKIPKDKNGNFMALLLQINLKDIDIEGYPKSGILEIFAAPVVDFPHEFVIHFFEDGLTPELELPYVDLEQFFVTKPMKIQFQKTIEHMPLSDYRCTDVLNEILRKYNTQINNVYDLSSDDIEVLQNVIETAPATIGGYADFTQIDPRDEFDNRNECLFKLDSFFDKDIFIGDSGILTVTGAIDNSNRNPFKDFSLDWDCC